MLNMLKTLEALKLEHSKIVDVLNDIKKRGISSKEGRETLLLAKESILKHLEREDKDFYPKIRELAKLNKETQMLLKEFDDDMEHITSYTLGFFDGNSLFNNRDMNVSIERFIEVLKRRIQREDNILFPEYEKQVKETLNKG